ncbi:TonB-dependent siderophore receptor [Halotalea alkalilenta]|uniref:TonB-dependent siderophore receptor n=1 Tax=Halotalea alkalilenta TaxID=376489 RepID=UPI0006940406|nr:TonB-dependent receptor [Halotalea alkalilenta]
MKPSEHSLCARFKTPRGFTRWMTTSAMTAGSLAAAMVTADAFAQAPGAPASSRDTSALQASEARLSFSIPAQPLSDALAAFGRQAGLQVSADAGLVAGVSAAPVDGVMTPGEALDRLLSGTGLAWHRFDGDTVTLSRRPVTEENAALSTLTVVGSRLPSEWAPVDGYRAVSSATATKTNTALRDIPQSIQVIPRELIEDRQVIQLSEAVESVSSVQQASTSGNRAESFRIRGFDAPGYAIDGVMLNPVGDRPETFLDMANVERVEVLKGPASALYGRAQPGGLINIVTRRPSDTFEGDATVQAGSEDFRRAQGSISGPIDAGGELTGRLTGATQREDGFRGSAAARSERQLASLALRWTASEATTFTFGIDHTEQETPFDRGLIVTADNAVSLPRDRFLAESWSRVEARKTRFSFGAEHLANDWLTLRGTVRYDDAKVRDTGIDFRGLEDDGRTLNRRYTDRTEDSTNLVAQFEGIATFDVAGMTHRLLGGVEYAKSRMDFLSYRANIDPIDIYTPVYGAVRPAASLNSDYTEDIELYSIFAQDQIDLSSQWKLLAGLRYDQVRQTMEQRAGSSDPDIDDGSMTGRLGIVYQPITPLSLYASFSQSFSPQSGMAQDGAALIPEEGEQLELGLKADLIADRLSLTSSVFQITKQNVATSDPRNPDADYSLQTGEQRVRGVELDIIGQLTPGWEVVASAAYLDARITEDETLEVGNRLTGVPLWSSSLWSTYEFQSGRLAGLSLGGGITTVGSRKGDLDNSYQVDGYQRLDATLGYPLSEHVELSLTAKNLTDEEYIATPVSRTENHPGAPRSLIMAVRASF